LFSCDSADILTQERGRYSFAIPADNTSIDQALYGQREFLPSYGYKVDSQGYYVKVPIDNYVNDLLQLMATDHHMPIQLAAYTLQNRPEYDYVYPLVLGDRYSRLAKVYLGNTEFTSPDVTRSSWYYIPPFNAGLGGQDPPPPDAMVIPSVDKELTGVGL
jgi:hypothetical protein